MNEQLYKNLRLIGAMTICASALALKLEAYALAGACLAVGILLFFSGVDGAWFNDGWALATRHLLQSECLIRSIT